MFLFQRYLLSTAPAGRGGDIAGVYDSLLANPWLMAFLLAHGFQWFQKHNSFKHLPLPVRGLGFGLHQEREHSLKRSNPIVNVLGLLARIPMVSKTEQLQTSSIAGEDLG